MHKHTQAVIDAVATELKTNGSRIGSRQAYEDLQALCTRLNGLGVYEIIVPVDFNADITAPAWPGIR